MLGKEEFAELGHEAVIQRGEVLQAVGARLLQPLEKEYLLPRVHLLEQLAEVGDRVAASRDAQDVVDEALDELLGDIRTREQAIGDFARRQHLLKRHRLGCERDCRRLEVRHRHLYINGRAKLRPLYKRVGPESRTAG